MYFAGSPAFPMEHHQHPSSVLAQQPTNEHGEEEEEEVEEEVKAFRYEGDGGSMCHGQMPSSAQQGRFPYYYLFLFFINLFICFKK